MLCVCDNRIAPTHPESMSTMNPTMNGLRYAPALIVGFLAWFAAHLGLDGRGWLRTHAWWSVGVGAAVAVEVRGKIDAAFEDGHDSKAAEPDTLRFEFIRDEDLDHSNRFFLSEA